MERPCVKPASCPDSVSRWEVTASVLQVIWGDLFPRMVADGWSKGSDTPFGTGDVTNTLHQEIEKYVGTLLGSGNVYTDRAAFDASPFGKRVGRVLAYLTGPDPTKIPIRYLGAGQFDFVLSDQGLDLFSPRSPYDEPDLLHFYQIRDPGRSTLGIPHYLAGANDLAFDVQSPAGPSQVWLDQAALDTMIGGPDGTCRLADLSCLEALPKESFPRISILKQHSHPKQRSDDEGRPVFSPVQSVTIQGFTEAASKVRCWQLEGSVYRGILEQLPRVVATVWREHYMVCHGNAKSYYARWFAGNLREIFMDRMETHIPDASRMVFEPADVVDVTISNQGIYFPQLRKPCSDAGPGVKMPDLKEMVLAIARGSAGNPVFTDTRRPPRDE